jgi:hypothetical protein
MASKKNAPVTTVRIIGKTYKLLEVENLDNQGLCEDDKQQISIRKDLHLESWADTVIHECAHAIDFNMKLGLTERQVHCIGSGLWALLADNPELTQRICQAVLKPKGK